MLPARIARWMVENDPSWEKTIDADVGVFKWTKKGTGIQAVASPTSMFCDVIGDDSGASAVLSNPLNGTGPKYAGANIATDITKYLSSAYLNPRTGQPATFQRKSRF